MNLTRFIRFVAAGGLAALVNFGSRIAFSEVMPYLPAIVLAYCMGMFTAFVLNRAFVFTDSTNVLKQQATWFVLVNVAAVAQTVLLSLLFARWIFPSMGLHEHAELLGHAIGVVVPVFTSYIGHNTLTFRR